LSTIGSYQVALNRQETVHGELQPAEDVVLSIRREPRAVRLEWPSGKNKGREVLYSPRETGGKMMVHTPGSLIPTVPLDPNSPLVMRNSRHPITEAGLDSVLDNLENSLRPHESGQAGGATISLAGTETPPEVGRACQKIVETRENGENWVVYLDAQTDLPAMVRGVDASGSLLESYVFGVPAIDPPSLASADAFDPDARWGGGGGRGGLFGRMAGGADSTATSGPR
jgi:hypothetical protein